MTLGSIRSKNEYTGSATCTYPSHRTGGLLCGLIAICAMILPGISGSFFFGTGYVLLHERLKGSLKGHFNWIFSACTVCLLFMAV